MNRLSRILMTAVAVCLAIALSGGVSHAQTADGRTIAGGADAKASPGLTMPVLRYDYRRDRFDSFYSIDTLLKVFDHRTHLTTLDACRSSAGSFGQFQQFRWVLHRAGSVTLRFTAANCSVKVNLPEGSWGGTLTVHTSAGSDFSRPVSVAAKDLLVVSIGDSMASGEGNPDIPGNYLPFPTARAQWKFEPCHRSAVSGPAQAAKTLSGDPHTGVVFVALPCTGATTDNIFRTSHRGQLPQLADVRRAVCHFGCNRQIDLLMVTAGVNDIGFADIVEYCGILHNLPFSPCGSALSSAEAKVTTIKSQLLKIKNSMAARGLSASKVVLTEYPANIFAGGCATQAARIAALANHLNTALRQAAADNGWIFASGVTAAFTGHSFCRSGSSSWFRSLRTSVDMQGDELGTAHPTAPGQQAIAAAIVRACRPA